MWLFTIYGFYSIACATGANGEPDPETIMIRARKRQHLENLKERFPAIAGDVLRTDDSDYRYRVVLLKADWLPVLSSLGEEQAWSNFKNQVHKNYKRCGTDYGRAVHEVWETMHGLQQYKG